MAYPIYQVDAFTNQTFGGNPAAVVPLDAWLPDEVLQKIALENNLSETAFFIPTKEGFHLRWFTPTVEINLCGHATLATSYVIFNELDYKRDLIKFESRSGELIVAKKDNLLTLNFPAWQYTKIDLDDRVSVALGANPIELYDAPDWLAVFEHEDIIQNMTPDMLALSKIKECRGIIVTAPANDKEVDFISRWFGPNEGIDEDPVTGSAHCVLSPYWATKLNKKEFNARQISARGGELHCILDGDRVHISGQAVLYMKGEIYV
ncbi:MAG: PhzF family phenazine biosynthesis protein [Alphaproteobacteria bacterium]|nr:PhzF family phenazine biosynthesis protein [Alphaproteobacteria bacterium]NCQ89044.1 PhzF family phenazine biosynthesis protein [Alphaproteobacteria bacterium]NCT07944.1 PhzF family phenazine biosynthesis protein [Alphaproteobacteria bacterium]